MNLNFIFYPSSNIEIMKKLLIIWIIIATLAIAVVGAVLAVRIENKNLIINKLNK